MERERKIIAGEGGLRYLGTLCLLLEPSGRFNVLSSYDSEHNACRFGGGKSTCRFLWAVPFLTLPSYTQLLLSLILALYFFFKSGLTRPI